jgi:hypothetical protein
MTKSSLSIKFSHYNKPLLNELIRAYVTLLQKHRYLAYLNCLRAEVCWQGVSRMNFSQIRILAMMLC